MARTVPLNEFLYSGQWTIGDQAATAGPGAGIDVEFQAKHVYLVLGGNGHVHVTIDGRPAPSVDVDSYRLYTLRDSGRIADAMLVVPIDFLRLPLIAVVGTLFFGEPLELSIMLGAAVIFAGTYYSIRRESRRLAKPGTDHGL